jgi:Uma2 family endonuclease
MIETAGKGLTFEEFQALDLDGRYELADGRLEALVSPKPEHGWTQFRFPILIGPQAQAIDPGGYWGSEVEIPTIPRHGRVPDFVYYSSEDRHRVSIRDRKVYGVPTLAVEILSEDDERRDRVTKRREYAQAGIRHYWLLDPRARTVTTLVLREGKYDVAGRFSGGDSLTSELFPGLAVPLSELFPADE